jgi:hypothetical protein
VIEAYKADITGKTLTLSDTVALLAKSVMTLVNMANRYEAYPPGVRRQAVIDAATKLYVDLLKPLHIPGVPALFETTVIDPLIEREIPILVGGLVDAMTAVLANPSVTVTQSTAVTFIRTINMF